MLPPPSPGQGTAQDDRARANRGARRAQRPATERPRYHGAEGRPRRMRAARAFVSTHGVSVAVRMMLLLHVALAQVGAWRLRIYAACDHERGCKCAGIGEASSNPAFIRLLGLAAARHCVTNTGSAAGFPPPTAACVRRDGVRTPRCPVALPAAEIHGGSFGVICVGIRRGAGLTCDLCAWRGARCVSASYLLLEPSSPTVAADRGGHPLASIHPMSCTQRPSVLGR